MQLDKKKLLTIALPTYSRPDKLQKQIRLLLPQLTREVEILVLDNDSPYDVNQLFTENENEKITIRKNKINVGMPSNYIRCLEYADGDWVWTLSDDDPVLPNAIQSILSVIQKMPDAISICMNTPFDLESRNLEEFVAIMRNQQAFSMHFWMSVCVYNLAILRPYLYLGCNDLTTMIAPLLVVLRYLEKNVHGRCILSSCPIIASAEEMTSWKKTDFLIRLFLVYDLFRIHSKHFKHTFFYGVTHFCLLLIIKGLKEQSIIKQDAQYLLKILFFKMGRIYIITHFLILYLKIIIYLFFPPSWVYEANSLRKNFFKG